jgi:hypothetical protein
MLLLLSAVRDGDPGEGDVLTRIQQVEEGCFDIVTEFPATAGPMDDVVVTGHIGLPVIRDKHPTVHIELTDEAFGRPAEMHFEEEPLLAFRILLRFFRSRDTEYTEVRPPNPNRAIRRLCRRVLRRSFGQPPTPKPAGMDLNLLLLALSEERSPLDERVLFAEVVQFLLPRGHLNPKEGLDALEWQVEEAARTGDGYSGQGLRRWIDRQMAETIPA